MERGKSVSSGIGGGNYGKNQISLEMLINHRINLNMIPGKVKYGTINMEWKEIKNEKTVKEIEEISTRKPVVIFKHSTRCPISGNVLGKLKNSLKEEGNLNAEFFILDIISYRDISGFIAEQFDVIHESPQVLIIKNRKSIYKESHFDIQYHKLKEKIMEEA